MAESFCFNKRQRFWVGEALEIAETQAGDFFQIDLKDVERFPYDLQTLAYLQGQEKTRQALAQVCKYEVRKREFSWHDRAKEFYRICLQDDRILQTVQCEAPSLLKPLLLYVITHEIIHVVRFSMDPPRFYLDAQEKGNEERSVHRITYEILRPLRDPQVGALLEHYRPWWEAETPEPYMPALDIF